MAVKISVIIPTKNRAEFLAEEIELLSIQTLSADDFEVIVSDNGSTDRTKEVCEAAKGKIKNFVYLYSDAPGAHTGRNVAFPVAKGDILVFIDDDILMPETWLDAILKGFAETDADVIGGNCLPEFEAEPPEWLKSLWVTDKKRGLRILACYSCVDFSLGGGNRKVSPHEVYSCNMAIKKSIIEECQGFIPDYIMSGPYFYYQGDGETGVARYVVKNGYSTWYMKEASIRHRVPLERMKKEYAYRVSNRNGAGRMFALLHDHGLKKAVLRLLKDFLLLFRDIPRLKGIWRINRLYVMKGKIQILFAYLTKKSVREWIHQPNYLNELGRVPMDRK